MLLGNRNSRLGVLIIVIAAAVPAQTNLWRIQGLQDPGPFRSVFFLDAGTGWISAGRSKIFKSVDNGSHWSLLNTDLEAAAEVAHLWFADANRGWAAGAIEQRPTVWQTEDGGSHWRIRYTQPRAFDRSNGAMLDVQFASDTKGWAVGYNGLNATIAATTDGGANWSLQYSGSEIAGQFSRVRFWDSHRGWALSSSAVMKTIDGGESWSLSHFGGDDLLHDIDLTGPSEAWVAGAWGHLIHTVDGARWAEVRATSQFRS